MSSTDRALGIKAGRPVLLSKLEIPSPNKRHGQRYEPSPHTVVGDLLAALPRHEVVYENTTFVDLGAGKGRVLCIASAFPFKQIIGVEFSPTLMEIAEENLEQMTASKRCPRIALALKDAARFKFPSGPLVIYMFNPFDAPVMKEVLANLRTALAQQKRPIHLLYYMPQHAALLDRAPFLTRVDQDKDWVVWSAQPR